MPQQAENQGEDFGQRRLPLGDTLGQGCAVGDLPEQAEVLTQGTVRIAQGDFAQGVKQAIPAGGTVRIFAGVLEGKVKYYLLPIKVSASAPFIAVYRDPAISFDPAQKTLNKDDVVVATNAELLTTLGKDGFLYRSSGGGNP